MKNSVKYATIDIPNAMGFSRISKEMEKDGHFMTPARTRTILLKSLGKITEKVGIKYGCKLSREKSKLITKEPDFQNTIAFFIERAYDE